MSSKQLTLAQCAAVSGLGPHEIVLGRMPCAVHDFLYADYLLDRGGSWEGVSDLIVADIRSSLAQGAWSDAADLLIVLRRLLLKRLRMAPVRCLYSNRGVAISSRVPANAPVELRAWDAGRRRIIAVNSESACRRSPSFALRDARRRADRQ